MKTFLVMVLSSILAAPLAQANTISVHVQCGATGALSSGTLTVTTSGASACKNYPDKAHDGTDLSVSGRTYQNVKVTLSFKGLTYSGSIDQAQLTYDGLNCLPQHINSNSMDSSYPQDLYEVHSGYDLEDFDLYDSGGAYGGDFSLDNGTECSFQ